MLDLYSSKDNTIRKIVLHYLWRTNLKTTGGFYSYSYTDLISHHNIITNYYINNNSGRNITLFFLNNRRLNIELGRNAVEQLLSSCYNSLPTMSTIPPPSPQIRSSLLSGQMQTPRQHQPTLICMRKKSV